VDFQENEMKVFQQQKSTQQQKQADDTESVLMQESKTDHLKERQEGKLLNKVALITGGDSGLGRAVAIAFAKEGADIVITYSNNSQDAEQTKELVEKEGRSCLAIAGNVMNEEFCQQAVQQTIDRFQKLDILVNNAVQEHPPETEDPNAEQLERDLDTSICSMFYMTDAAVPYLKEGSIIINTTSVAAYKDSQQLVDNPASKGAIMTFTRSSSQSLEEKGIRVNGITPGPVWTLQVPSTSPTNKVKEFDNQLPKGPVIDPEAIAPSFVYLASDESSYMAGQILFSQTRF
jgi:NAD(P)-dependent dehydrogenase (short-subunit alcohol dehydrogenase family)